MAVKLKEKRAALPAQLAESMDEFCKIHHMSQRQFMISAISDYILKQTHLSGEGTYDGNTIDNLANQVGKLAKISSSNQSLLTDIVTLLGKE